MSDLHAFIEDVRTLLRKHAWILQDPNAKSPQETISSESTATIHHKTSSKIPDEALNKIHRLMGLRHDQIDTIMTLVSLPENGSSQWDSFYNYIEWGDDHSTRGFTTTIFGATSGTGSLLKVFDHLARIHPKHPLLAYHAALKKAKAGSVQGLEKLAHVGGDHTKAKANYANYVPNGRAHLDHIDGDLARLPNTDASWRLAVWEAFIELNWESASHFCAKTGPCAGRPGPVLTTPLAKGWIVDCSLNHGDCRYWKDADTWTVIFKHMKSPESQNENEWIRDMMKARQKVLKSGYAALDWSKTGDRCLLWMDLLKKNNVHFERPIKFTSSTATPYPIWQPNLELR